MLFNKLINILGLLFCLLHFCFKPAIFILNSDDNLIQFPLYIVPKFSGIILMTSYYDNYTKYKHNYINFQTEH